MKTPLVFVAVTFTLTMADSANKSEILNMTTSSTTDPNNNGNFTSSPEKDQQKHKCSDVCLTEDCVLAAATVLSSLDRTVDPCTDFYQYACGGWVNGLQSQNVDRFQILDKRNQNMIHRILLSDNSSLDQSTAEGKTKSFYQSCIGENDESKENLPYLQSLIDGVGGWNLSGIYDPEMSFDRRMQKMHNISWDSMLCLHGGWWNTRGVTDWLSLLEDGMMPSTIPNWIAQVKKKTFSNKKNTFFM